MLRVLPESSGQSRKRKSPSDESTTTTTTNNDHVVRCETCPTSAEAMTSLSAPQRRAFFHHFQTNGELFQRLQLEYQTTPLGAGAFGSVAVVTASTTDKQQWAVKSMSAHGDDEFTFSAPLVREIASLRALRNNPYVVQLDMVAFVGFESAHLFLELGHMDVETFANEVLVNDSDADRIRTIRHFMRQMVVGLQSIHDAGLTHRDIKLDNMLVMRHVVSNELVVQYTDFGSAVGAPVEWSFVTSERYVLPKRPPEILLQEVGFADVYAMPLATTDYDRRAETWALGICFWQLLTLVAPRAIPDSMIAPQPDPSQPLRETNEWRRDQLVRMLLVLDREPRINRWHRANNNDDETTNHTWDDHVALRRDAYEQHLRPLFAKIHPDVFRRFVDGSGPTTARSYLAALDSSWQPDALTEMGFDLFTQMCDVDPKRRISLVDARRNHPFLADMSLPPDRRIVAVQPPTDQQKVAPVPNRWSTHYVALCAYFRYNNQSSTETFASLFLSFHLVRCYSLLGSVEHVNEIFFHGALRLASTYLDQPFALPIPESAAADDARPAVRQVQIVLFERVGGYLHQQTSWRRALDLFCSYVQGQHQRRRGLRAVRVDIPKTAFNTSETCADVPKATRLLLANHMMMIECVAPQIALDIVAHLAILYLMSGSETDMDSFFDSPTLAHQQQKLIDAHTLVSYQTKQFVADEQVIDAMRAMAPTASELTFIWKNTVASFENDIDPFLLKRQLQIDPSSETIEPSRQRPRI